MLNYFINLQKSLCVVRYNQRRTFTVCNQLLTFINSPPSFSGSDKPDNVEKSIKEPLQDCDRNHRLSVLQLEVDIARHEGRRVPKMDFFNDNHWNYILTLPSKSARMKYYGYLWKIEIRKLSRKLKKEEKSVDVEERIDEIRRERRENPHIVYGLGHVTMFLRIYDSTINNMLNSRLIRAMQFSPKIVLDCSYDAYMTKREAECTSKQLMFSFSQNRAHDDPFDLHYCNVNMESLCMKSLHRYIPTMLNPDFPMNIHSKCFTELFPKENLVYLTPHCRTDLQSYNADDIYIIGSLVDLIHNQPLSLAKAKRLNLRMARLPLDNYLQWGAGSGKSLTINQMMSIMLDLKQTGDWEKALRHVPRRKIVDESIESKPSRNHSKIRTPHRINIKMDKIMKDSDNEQERTQFQLSSWGVKNTN